VLGAGLLILPGGKLGIQKWLKTRFVSTGTEIYDSGIKNKHYWGLYCQSWRFYSLREYEAILE